MRQNETKLGIYQYRENVKNIITHVISFQALSDEVDSALIVQSNDRTGDGQNTR